MSEEGIGTVSCTNQTNLPTYVRVWMRKWTAMSHDVLPIALFKEN